MVPRSVSHARLININIAYYLIVVTYLFTFKVARSTIVVDWKLADVTCVSWSFNVTLNINNFCFQIYVCLIVYAQLFLIRTLLLLNKFKLLSDSYSTFISLKPKSGFFIACRSARRILIYQCFKIWLFNIKENLFGSQYMSWECLVSQRQSYKYNRFMLTKTIEIQYYFHE